jgi:cytokinesis protein
VVAIALAAARNSQAYFSAAQTQRSTPATATGVPTPPPPPGAGVPPRGAGVPPRGAGVPPPESGASAATPAAKPPGPAPSPPAATKRPAPRLPPSWPVDSWRGPLAAPAGGLPVTSPRPSEDHTKSMRPSPPTASTVGGAFGHRCWGGWGGW